MRKLWGWAASALVLATAGSGAFAQETATPVGPPELRDFALPGTPPPAEEAQPAPATTTPPTDTVPQQQAPAEPAPRQAAPVTIIAPPAPPPPRQQASPLPPAAEQAEPAPEPLPEIEGEPIPPSADTASPPPAATPVVRQEEATSDLVWIAALVGLLAALAGLAALWKFLEARRANLRRSPSVTDMAARRAAELPGPAATASLAPKRAAELARPSPPAAEPAAIRAGTAPAKEAAATAARPNVDILFKPAKAEATEAGASVHYELIVKNLGNVPARNVRIEARMFNGGNDQEKEIGAFFKQPLQEALAARPFEIPARSQAKLSRVVSLDKDHVRAITVQGRRLLIPMVAFNILYDWEGETGQTSRCFVVGREADSPGDKMAPFRLDLGPRVYRTVGQRATALTRIA